MSLNLNNFVEKYAEINKMSKVKSKEEILRFTDTYKTCTVEDGGVNINGFIKSEVVSVPAKKSRNPKTGETIDIAPKKVVKVRIAPKFKNMEE